ncbi:MAG TPA: SRPBCC domain-containing protein [Bryobacteraceae bacterium]|nr:SRPBCC domain-containing protein [Bryobacteraceae bacterium]
MPELPHHLDRTIVIRANPETVFRFFTDSERWAKWWGAGSTIDAQPGGKVYIRHPNGIEVLGDVLDVHPPERIVFTYGYGSGKPIPAGSSRVTIRLEPDESGTRLHLRHEFADAGPRDQHVQGWRFQLSLFSNVVADEAYADAVNTVDAWYGAWAITDDQSRAETFAKIAAPGICFRDRFSLLDGLDELTAHAGAAQRFMPGMGLQRKGPVRHCQGSVLADWTAAGGDGKERMSGTSVFVFKPDGRIDGVTSFTNPSPAL